MDIVYLFWSIASGIVLGAGMLPLAVLGTAFVGIVLIALGVKKVKDLSLIHICSGVMISFSIAEISSIPFSAP